MRLSETKTSNDQRISVYKPYCTIHRIEVYPVDSVIYPLNDLGLDDLVRV